MAWNEPGGDKKDPWSGREDEKGPPDLDEAIRSLQEKLGGLFGGGNNEPFGGFSSGMGYLVIGALALWGMSGFYTVDQGTRGVETRFGKYTDTTEPGLNWHIPAPVEQVQIVDVEQQRFIEVGYRSAGSRGNLGAVSVPKEALMLTRDENIVDVRLAVQYQVKNAKDFLFNVHDPVSTLKQVTESAERGVIGNNDLDFVLTEGRSEIVAEIKKEIQEIMDAYQSGIQITSVNLQDAQPPEQVQSAFEDAIKAREDKQRLINEAEAYANDVVPKARGAASRKVQEAEGYKARVISAAEGEANRFEKLLTEYHKAPEVTRKRLYLETMAEVLSKTKTIMVDVKGSNNLLYLPLDKLVDSSVSAEKLVGKPGNFTQPVRSSNANTRSTMRTRTSSRGRDGRGR